MSLFGVGVGGVVLTLAKNNKTIPTLCATLAKEIDPDKLQILIQWLCEGPEILPS